MGATCELLEFDQIAQAKSSYLSVVVMCITRSTPMDERHILIAVCFSFIAVESVLQCPNELTEVVEGYSEGYSTFEKVNDTHIRVCSCKVRPCLKKCCGKGQTMENDTCHDEGDSRSDGFPHLDTTNFQLLYGNGCPGEYYARFYPDEYTNVHYYLGLNGTMSIFFDADLRQIHDFCLERVSRDSPGKHSGLVICIPKDLPPGQYEFPVGMVMSLPFLVATLVVYSFRELRNINSKNLISHVASLLAAYLSIIFVEIIKFNIPESVCIVLGLIRQFSFLSSFFWLNVMCFDLWLSLSNWSSFKTYSKDKEQKRYLKYSVCGWGCPAVIVLVTVIMDFTPVPHTFIKPGISYPNCFIQDGKPFYAYFYGPVIFIFCVDVTLFILSAVRFITARRNMKFTNVQDKIYMQNAKTRYFLLLKIFVMMGFNWIIDPFSWLFESSLWTWLFIHLSITLQSVSIFVIFVWRTDVKKLLVSKFCSNSCDERTSISLLHTLPPRNQEIRIKRREETTSC